MPEIVQEIGAYAGLASVVGLAVLSALYFSQARDVKRLREWAGRAPERSGQGAAAVPGRVVAQPQQAAAPSAPAPPPVPGSPAVPAKPAVAGAAGRPAAATPAGQAAPAVAASAAGAGAATAQQGKPQGTPVPAAQNANAGAAATSGAPGTPQATGPAAQKPAASAGTAPPTAPPAPSSPPDAPSPARTDAPSSASPASPDAPAPARPDAPAQAGRPDVAVPPRQAAAATPAGGRGGAPPSVPSSSGRFASRSGPAPRQSPQETKILPPRAREPWYSRLGARYLALVLAGLVVLGGAAAYGVTQLTGGNGGSSGRQSAPGNAAATDGSGKAEHKQGGAVKPGNVTVAVLNGTTVPGLAATLSDEVGAAGFKVGTITNFTDQQLAESVVQYAPGHEAEARAVSRRLGIGQREPVNPSSQALAGDASVIVIAGADKAP
ncbi:MAG: hypothetical protein QOD71_3271 [Thermoleophilaceae bacterium]|nr:hypothetical protein [Thermoleophilaceae bacterium]